MKHRGFTLIELVVALAITVVVLGLTLPHLNYFSRNVDRDQAIQQIDSCIQKAEQTAASPDQTAIAHYSQLHLHIDGSNNLICDQYAISSPTTLSQAMASLSGVLVSSTSVSGIGICSLQVAPAGGAATPATPASFAGTHATLDIWFDSLAKGVAVGVSGKSFSQAQPDISLTSANFEQGIKVVIGFNLGLTPCTATKNVIIPFTGGPIQLSST